MKFTLSCMVFVSLLLASCTQKAVYQEMQGDTMGTQWHIKFIPSEETPVPEHAAQLLAEYNEVLSTYIPESQLSLLNASDSGMTFSGRAYEWMKTVWMASESVNSVSNGAFDPSASALFNAWGFGEKEGNMSDSASIDSILGFIGMDQFEWKDSFLKKRDPRASLNFNAIAKGYGVDVLCQLLDSHNIQHYYVEIGGEVRCKGENNQGKPWTIGINRPEEGSSTQSLFSVVKLENRAIATSGNYRNYKERDGKRWAHTIDPRTGYPIQSDVLSASIIAPDCMTADALATACMVMGRKACLDMVNQMEGAEAYLIGSDENGTFTEHISAGMKALMVEE